MDNKEFREKVAEEVDPAWGDFRTLGEEEFQWKPFDNAPKGMKEMRTFSSTFVEGDNPTLEQRVKEELFKKLAQSGMEEGSYRLESTRKLNDALRLTECTVNLHCFFPCHSEEDTL